MKSSKFSSDYYMCDINWPGSINSRKSTQKREEGEVIWVLFLVASPAVISLVSFLLIQFARCFYRHSTPHSVSDQNNLNLWTSPLFCPVQIIKAVWFSDYKCNLLCALFSLHTCQNQACQLCEEKKEENKQASGGWMVFNQISVSHPSKLQFLLAETRFYFTKLSLRTPTNFFYIFFSRGTRVFKQISVINPSKLQTNFP